ncbi:cyclododecanone monooxygenase [Hyaloraphidium curvatum]|nr:cyclododecanone monooxygenase [Hyaloraphidium curvatum]
MWLSSPHWCRQPGSAGPFGAPRARHWRRSPTPRPTLPRFAHPQPAELKAKYLHERDKRVRSEHGGQYIVVGEGPKGEKYARWLDDPHSERKEREPMEEEVEVLVLGAGFSGLQMGARLKDFGITDFKIVDTAGDVGGTWYWNRYPGVACDSEAYCYLPLLEELGYMPSARYISGNEIREHCVRLAKHWDLYPHMVFQTKCVDLRWSEDDKRWIVKTDRGDTFRARFLAACGGPINVPHLPDVPGIETFKGHEFHTSRWDYKYTGGNPEKNDLNLVNLKGKRVAIIGTGATAVQCIPYLAEWSKELYVFQRTPSAVAPRENTPTDPAWWKSLPKGWQRDRDRKFNQADLGTEPEDGLDDGFSLSFYSWNSLVREARRAGDNHGHSDAELMQLADFRHMEWLRKRVRDTVKDPKKAELLCPYYNLWCKRPVFSDTYLEAFNRDSVHVIDTSEAKGIERITEKGVVVNGTEYEVDCIVWSTGFEAPGFKTDFRIVGRDGLTRDEKWMRDMRIACLYGILQSGFPNLIYFGLIQGTISPNFPSIYYIYASMAAYIINEMVKRGVKEFDVDPKAEADWAAACIAANSKNPLQRGPQFLADCTPGYYNGEGSPQTIALAALAAPYGGGIIEYNQIVTDWMNSGELKGMILKK